MSRSIFKIMGIGMMASAALFMLSFLLFSLLKLAFFFLVVGGIVRFALKKKFQNGFQSGFRKGFQNDNITPLNAFESADFFYGFHPSEKTRRNRESVSISIQ